MFRLSNQQSKNNHRIIHQTTKISSAHTPTRSKLSNFVPIQISNPEITDNVTQEKKDQSPTVPKPASSIEPGPDKPHFDVFSFVQKMKKYQNYMAILEQRNIDLKILNAQVKSENLSLKFQLELVKDQSIEKITKIDQMTKIDNMAIIDNMTKTDNVTEIDNMAKMTEAERLSPLPKKADCILSNYFAPRPQ